MIKQKGSHHGPIHSHDDAVAHAIRNGPQPGDAMLSIRQPFALMVVEQWKPIENRSWSTKHLGLLWIHASKSKPPGDWKEFCKEQSGIPHREIEAFDFAFGAIIGAAWLDGCYPLDLLPRHMSGSVHAEGEFCWHFTAADSLEEPIPYKGAVGLLRYDPCNIR